MLLFIKTNLIYTEAPRKELRHKELDVYLSCLCVLVVSWLILIEVFKALPSVGLVGPGMFSPGPHDWRIKTTSGRRNAIVAAGSARTSM
jgi:hypothetical protein